MKLTNKQREEIAYRACELVKSKYTPSCLAVLRSNKRTKGWGWLNMYTETEYAIFWEVIIRRELEGEDFDESDIVHQRIMAIQMWANAPDDIREGILGL